MTKVKHDAHRLMIKHTIHLPRIGGELMTTNFDFTFEAIDSCRFAKTKEGGGRMTKSQCRERRSYERALPVTI